jgi:HD-like signal output (HDOD) protein
MPDARIDPADPFAGARAALAARIANRRAAAGERLTIDEMVAGVAELRPLPAVAFRVLELSDDAKFSAHELASLIASDQALTSKILRLANSPFYGFARRITTVRDAVVLLGFRTVRQSTLAACVVGDVRRSTSLDYDAFWQFCVATGMLSEVLARTEGRYQDQAFTAGVLHQVGVLALDQFRGDLLRAVIERSATGVSRTTAERDILGFTTAELGGALAEHWGFPSDLVGAIGGQTRAVDELAAEGGLAATVARARLYARAYGMSDGVTPTSEATPPEEWTQGPLAASLRQAGGMETILERVDAFMAAAAA